MRALRTAVALGALAALLSTEALAAPAAKDQRWEVEVTDLTPEPYETARVGMACSGGPATPPDEPIAFDIPGPGLVKIEILGHVGDWAIEITDRKGQQLRHVDENWIGPESMSMRVQAAQRIHVLPCNYTGTPHTTLTVAYRYVPPKPRRT